MKHFITHKFSWIPTPPKKKKFTGEGHQDKAEEEGKKKKK